MEPRIPMRAATVRSRLMLEAASELVGDFDGWPQKQSIISLREQGDESWGIALFASDAPGSIDAVMSGEAQIGIVNPGAVMAMAVRGTGPYPNPLPLSTITVLPQFDQLGFGVAERTGLRSLRDIAEQKYPLKVSLRGQRDHSVHLITNVVLQAHGFTLDDIVTWGGEVRYDDGLPYTDARMGAARRGEIDAIFDEAMPSFADEALSIGLRFLGIDEEHLQKLEAMGLRRIGITKEEFPALHEDVWSIDFSGWPVFVRNDLDENIITKFCAALEARKDRIPHFGTPGPLPLREMCTDTRDAPMMVPLHPAAERFWRSQGYL
jgi:TRAP-type uncharacterized transport system substrate-binding protein